MAQDRRSERSLGRSKGGLAPLRILYVSRENAPGDHGGAVHTWQVASLLAARGHAVSLLCHRRPGERRVETREGVAICRTNMAVFGHSVPLLGLIALLRTRWRGFDVVMERFDTFGGVGAVHALATGTPLLLEVNYPHLEEMLWKWRQRRSPLTGWARLLESWNLWQYSQATLAIAPRASIVPPPHRHKVILVHWGANTDHFRPLAPSDHAAIAALRDRLDLAQRRVVVSHGSFQPWHGRDVLPEIVAHVCAVQPEVVFLFLGQGPGIEEVERRVRARGLADACRFVGPVGHAEVPLHLGLAEAALAPFDTQAYPPLQSFGFFWSPAKIFEYMACGVPIVTTDQDYLRQVVEAERVGVCLPENDAHALSEALLALLGDTERRLQMGRVGRRMAVEKYSWQAHVAQLTVLLERLAAGHERGRARGAN